jgi:hypothetical protein
MSQSLMSAFAVDTQRHGERCFDFNSQWIERGRLGYDPIRIDPGSILDRIEQDRTGLSRIDPGSIL